MIRYRLDVADAHAHLFRVTLTISEPAVEQGLSLPVWIPGSYLVREFARHLSQLEARQGTRAVRLVQHDKSSWVAHCECRAALTVSYSVYAFDTSVRAAYLDAGRGFFNGTSVFLRVQGREAEPQQLVLGTLPRGWQVATGLPAVGACFEAADYDELVDHPVELGRFWRGSFQAAGVAHEFVVAGALPGFDGERLLADSRRICETQIVFWHGTPSRGSVKPPFQRYLFLLNAVEDSYGGLEHRASTALIANRRDLPRTGMKAASEGYATLLGLISHEYFHTWNVKRLRPAEFARYDYTRENYTELLWFFEGFTSYYDDLLLLRAGLIDVPRYLKLVARSINNVRATPGRAVQSVAQASFDAWVKYYRPDENTVNATVSYYALGSLIGLALDLTLRGEGRGSLDEVMRGLWARSGAAAARAEGRPAVRGAGGGPIDEADIAAVLQEVGGRSYAAELASWVHGSADLPLEPLLEGLGIVWQEEAATLAQRLGARVTDTGGQLKLQAVMRGGAAEKAGLAAGDELIALDGWRIRKLDDLAALGAFERPLPLLAARDQRLLELSLPSAQVHGPVALSVDAKAPAEALVRRAGWLANGA